MGMSVAAKPYRRAALLAVLVAAALAMAAGSALAAAAPVDINTADQSTLESLPGVGPSIAKEIIKGRPFNSVDDLGKVKGIGKAKLEKIRPLVTVGSPAAAAPKAAGAAAPALPKAGTRATKAAKPAVGIVNINTASQEQLEALPGIGPKKAQAIIAGRPYQKPEDIMKVKGIKQGIYNKIKDNITVQ